MTESEKKDFIFSNEVRKDLLFHIDTSDNYDNIVNRLLNEARADEWVTVNRLKNVISHLKEDQVNISNIGEILKLMQEDVLREGSQEILDSKEARRAIGKRTVKLFKEIFCKI